MGRSPKPELRQPGVFSIFQYHDRDTSRLSGLFFFLSIILGWKYCLIFLLTNPRFLCNRVTVCRCWLWKLGYVVPSSDLALTTAKISYPNKYFVQLSGTVTCILQMGSHMKFVCNQISTFHSPSIWAMEDLWWLGALQKADAPLWAYSCRELGSGNQTERIGLDQRKVFKSMVQSSSEDGFALPWVGRWQKRAQRIIPVPGFSAWLASCSSTMGFSITKGNHIFLIWLLLKPWKKQKLRFPWGSATSVSAVNHSQNKIVLVAM